MGSKWGLDWDCENLAQRGVTINGVINRQLDSERAHSVIGLHGKVDFWINVDGNDMMQMATKHHDYSILAQMMEDPFRNTGGLLKEASELMQKINNVGTDFYRLLNALYEIHGLNIGQIIVESLPNIGEADCLSAEQLGDEPIRIPLRDPVAKAFAEKVAISVNNRKSQAIKHFRERTGVAVVGIDTFEVENPFGDDQHFTARANDDIAEIASSRVVFAA